MRKIYDHLAAVIGPKTRVYVVTMTATEFKARHLNKKLDEFVRFPLAGDMERVITSTDIGGGEWQVASQALVQGVIAQDKETKRRMGRRGAWAAPFPDSEWVLIGETDLTPAEVYVQAREARILDEEKSDSEVVVTSYPEVGDEVAAFRYRKFIESINLIEPEEPPELDEQGRVTWPSPKALTG